nr:hypothetical protein [candidate division Zixibacteria bacterium]
MNNPNDQDRIRWNLGERLKELTALHKTARILQDDNIPVEQAIKKVAEFLPDAWQYPEITGARIQFGGIVRATEKFRDSEWVQKAVFSIHTGESGSIEVCYLENRPQMSEGPFLAEERDLIESLAEMLRSYLQHKRADEELQKAHDHLEQIVRQRTEELKAANAALKNQVAEYREAESKIANYQGQLRRLASELSLTEERERRNIAVDLHDHIGQALAFIKMKISEVGGYAVFSGLESSINDIVTLLNQTIDYTRSLTFEISPPILYELGLVAALEWLSDQFQQKHHLPVKMEVRHDPGRLSDEIHVVLFKSTRELLTNALKHGHPDRVLITVDNDKRGVDIRVSDDGRGFDISVIGTGSGDGFGLFSIKERIQYMGGTFDIDSTPGHGTTACLYIPHNKAGAK